MGRFRYRGVKLALAVLSLWAVAACGGRGKAGTPLFPGRITLTPSTSTSMVLGGIISFTSTVQTAGGTNLNVGVTFSSTDTSILNFGPGGAACAGHWDAAFTTCTPGNVGVVQVTASALGATSIPTYVFVHPQVDTITVTGVLLGGIPVQEPCLSQSQTMTLEAHAYSHGTDVTSSVGPFTWTANNTGVVNLTPLISNNSFNFATNQVTAKAVNPGITYIYATANGVTSNSFQQPQYTQTVNGTIQTSPVLNFFATCPIQNISLEVGAVGSGQPTFSVTKGTGSASVNVVATVTDIMGNSSLPNTNGNIVLSKIPLTWTASQPGSINVGSGCTQSCALSIVGPGSGSIAASCSPPTCNAGFPEIPITFLTNNQLDPTKVQSCTTFFQAEFPSFAGCQALIPMPVYSSPVFLKQGSPPIQLSKNAAISGVVIGTPGTTSVLAASTGCAHEPPSMCSSAAYYVSTAKAVPGGENPLPTPPNSFLFDAAGDKVFMGSDYGAMVINPANFGTSTSPFTSLGTVTGKVLGTNNTGTLAAFADTIHSPNQVYVVNTQSASGPVALNIPAATTAGFSPDGLKGFIAGGTNGTSLYVYSPLQPLQQATTPPGNPQLTLAQPANAIAFSPNGAFAFVAESAPDGSSANLTAFSTCDNSLAGSVSLPVFSLAAPHLPNLIMRVLPGLHMDGRDSLGNAIPDGIHIAVLDSTGFDLITATVSVPSSGGLCPQGLAFDPVHPVERIDLGQGTMTPLNFFPSADGTELYVVNSGSSSILIYSFIAGATIGGIELVGGATPLSADISADSGTILVSGSDGMLHEVTTQSGGIDLVQLAFPNLPNYYNAFCTSTPSAGPCALNAAVARP